LEKTSFGMCAFMISMVILIQAITAWIPYC